MAMLLHTVVQMFLQIIIVIAIALEPQIVPMNEGVRDVRTWHNPTDPAMSFTFSTPEGYEACPAVGSSDTIVASGIAKGWHLEGRLWLSYVTTNGRTKVPNGSHVIDFTSQQPNSSFSFEVEYPPAEKWPNYGDQSNQQVLHVDLAIVVTDETGELVRWIGGDPIHAPGTLGPGGQDWSITCFTQRPSLFLPLVSHS
jgi:hypothetical protein